MIEDKLYQCENSYWMDQKYNLNEMAIIAEKKVHDKKDSQKIIKI